MEGVDLYRFNAPYFDYNPLKHFFHIRNFVAVAADMIGLVAEPEGQYDMAAGGVIVVGAESEWVHGS